MNGVVSICRMRLDQRHHPGAPVCGHAAKDYVLVGKRWVPVCGHHRRSFTLNGFKARPIG